MQQNRQTTSGLQIYGKRYDAHNTSFVHNDKIIIILRQKLDFKVILM